MAGYDKNSEQYCPCCKKSKDSKNFTSSLNPEHNKVLPFCKSCVSNKLKKYREATNSDGKALYILCAEVGYPVVREYFDIALRKFNEKGSVNSRDNNFFLVYHNVLRDLNYVPEGFWQTDVDIGEFNGIEIKKDRAIKDYNELIKKWGHFKIDGEIDDEAYEFLEATFEEYTKGILEMDINLEKRYRDLAKAEFRKRRADESGDISEIAKAQENLKKILDMLKLSEFKSNIKSDEQLAFESRISMIEYTKPAECEDLKAYIDMVGYEKDRAQCFRSLRNAICGTREYPDIPKEER